MPVHSVIVWNEVCMDRGSCGTLGRLLSGLLSRHHLSHCQSLEMMTCLPLDFLTLLVFRHSLMTQVELGTCYYIFCVQMKYDLVIIIIKLFSSSSNHVDICCVSLLALC